MTKGPVKGVQIKAGRYYLVRAVGAKRVWVSLTRVREGLPALYAALSDELGRASSSDAMPSVVSEWCKDVMANHSAKTQVDEKRRANAIAEAFQHFRASEVETPDCYAFLQQFTDMPRTYDLFRAQLRSTFKFCELKGWRKAGSNPVDAISTMGYTPRTRYITDSELRRIKVGCLYGDDGKRTRSGMTMACLIELLYLTGGDVGVVLRLMEKRDPEQPDEPHVCDEGIFLRRDKTKRTSTPVIVEWTPRLRAVVSRLIALKAERKLRQRASQRVETPRLLVKQDGSPLTYESASTAWMRGVKRAKVPPTMMRDIRAKSATDKEESHGMGAASALLDHTTENQTADYVRRKKARKTGAVR